VSPRASETPSASLPILLCGILGGLIGGFNCCCWITPAITSFFAVRWARNLGPADRPLLGVGFMATLVSALLVSTFGTAVFLYINDPARMGESQQMVEDLLGSGGMSEMPMGLMAFAVASLGFVGTMTTGLLGAMLGAAGRGKQVRTAAARPGDHSATRFLAPLGAPASQPPMTPPAPAAAPVVAPEPAQAEPQVAVEPPAQVVQSQVAAAPVTAAPVVAAPVEPEPIADPDVEPTEDAPAPVSDWSRFQRPADGVDPAVQPDLDVSSEELASREGEAEAWGDED
jgi:hypothetical protein